MNIIEVRKLTAQAKRSATALGKIEEKHRRQVDRELRIRLRNTIQRAIELAAAHGESEATIERVWCRDPQAIEDVCMGEFMPLFKVTWEHVANFPHNAPETVRASSWRIIIRW